MYFYLLKYYSPTSISGNYIYLNCDSIEISELLVLNIYLLIENKLLTNIYIQVTFHKSSSLAEVEKQSFLCKNSFQWFILYVKHSVVSRSALVSSVSRFGKHK